MKFSEMLYTRSDIQSVKNKVADLTKQLEAVESYVAAKAVFLEKEELIKHVETQATLAHIRHDIDTRDEFYDGEVKFWSAAMPELEEYLQAWNHTMLESPFRSEFEAEYGNMMFLNTEMELKTFSPKIIQELQQENDLKQEYSKLLASAQIPFEEGVDEDERPYAGHCDHGY